MENTIVLPAALARHTGGRKSVTTPEDNLARALQAISREFALGEAVLTAEGQLQPYIRVVINNGILGHAQLANPDGIKLIGDTVELKTAFAGG